MVPVSQPCASQTADELEVEAEMFARLGDNDAAEALRREKAEAALQSDMSAFKAANPGACMEDFIRWHSPKDWRRKESKKEDDDAHAQQQQRQQQQPASPQSRSSEAKEASSSAPSRVRDPRRGELSARMRQANNRWQRLWRAAPAVAAFEQPPLFDPSSVGERTLDDLEHVEPASLLSQLSAVAVHNFLCAMARTPPAQHDIADCRANIAAAHPLVHSQPTTDGLHELARVELLCARATSLLYLFPVSLPLVDRLLLHRHTKVEGFDEREAVLSVFGMIEKDKAGAGAVGGGGSSRTAPPPLSSARKLPKPHRRSYTLFAPSSSLHPSVGDRLFALIHEAQQQPHDSAAASASTSSHQHGPASTTTTAPSSSASSPPGSQLHRQRHVRGDAGRSVRRMTELEDDEEEPALRLATAFQSHWHG